MREIKITEGVKIDINEELDKIITLVFACAFLMCLCMSFFDENFSSHVLHIILLFMKDLSLSSLY